MTRRLVCLSVPALAALSAARHVPQGRHFALLLLFDARDVAAAAISAVAERLLDEGLATFSVWGPDCERVHDILDESCVMREIRDGREYPVIMTGWYPDRPLEEAVGGSSTRSSTKDTKRRARQRSSSPWRMMAGIAR